MSKETRREETKKVMEQIDDILMDHNMYIVADSDGTEPWLVVGDYGSTIKISNEQLG